MLRSHGARQCLTTLRCTCGKAPVSGIQARRHLASAPGRKGKGRSSSVAGQPNDDVRWNYNVNPFDPAPRDASARAAYPVVCARDLQTLTLPPRKVRLLVRDFIDDSLYNPNYGYFPKQAVIFDPDANRVTEPGSSKEPLIETQGREGFDFSSIRSMTEWDAAVAETYSYIEEATSHQGAGRQVWHTPTELFKPYYAQAVAHHLASEYKLSLYPYNDLVIYEVGAGNGSLMTGILDYLQNAEPDIYKRTRYHTIEISPRLADLQQERAARRGHAKHVQIERQSIFDWQKPVTDPCFFLAFEVLDNLAHDVIRYTTEDHTPLQCLVEIDEKGEFYEIYEPVTDPLIKDFLAVRSEVRGHASLASTSFHPLLHLHPILRKLYHNLPFAPNLSPPDFLPTKSLKMLRVLKKYFPSHRILMSDFDYLPDTVPGRTAPVVQTRYQGNMVTCSTYLVSQGWFDIFFPTDFRFLRDMYERVMTTDRAEAASDASVGSLSSNTDIRWGSRRPLRVLSHKQFLQRYSEPEHTTLRDGSNPMLDLYENAAFIF